jgi:coproporphyrinogen III oxidase-like Fe-S oxidoreductase
MTRPARKFALKQFFPAAVFVVLLLLEASSFQALPANGRTGTQGISSGSSWLSNGNDNAAVSTVGQGEQQIGLYVHIPFCRRRCRYCNFAIVPIGTHADTESKGLTAAQSAFRAMDQNYTTAMLKEFALLQASPHDSTQTKTKIPLRSIYFGGGTPSLAPIETLRWIMSTILDEERSPFVLNLEDCEITIEVDPGTFTLEKLQAFKELGFNRLSLGVQSFDDRILESLGRFHRSKDIWESIAMIRRVYGDKANYSIDLISGLPGLSLATWIESLETAVRLEPRPVHLSIYDLQVESVSAVMSV